MTKDTIRERKGGAEIQKKSILGQLQIQMYNFLNFCFKCSVTCKSEGTAILFYYITYCIHDCTMRISITGLCVVVVVVVLAVFLQVEATV